MSEVLDFFDKVDKGEFTSLDKINCVEGLTRNFEERYVKSLLKELDFYIDYLKNEYEHEKQFDIYSLVGDNNKYKSIEEVPYNKHLNHLTNEEVITYDLEMLFYPSRFLDLKNLKILIEREFQERRFFIDENKPILNVKIVLNMGKLGCDFVNRNVAINKRNPEIKRPLFNELRQFFRKENISKRVNLAFAELETKHYLERKEVFNFEIEDRIRNFEEAFFVNGNSNEFWVNTYRHDIHKVFEVIRKYRVTNGVETKVFPWLNELENGEENHKVKSTDVLSSRKKSVQDYNSIEGYGMDKRQRFVIKRFVEDEYHVGRVFQFLKDETFINISRPQYIRYLNTFLVDKIDVRKRFTANLIISDSFSEKYEEYLMEFDAKNLQ